MTAFTDWLFEKTPSETEAPPSSPFIADAHLPTEDDELGDEIEPIEIEEVFSIIDYTDARRATSRRRITMRRLSAGPNGVILTAICHERRAVRCFRTERISAFIDAQTGEVLNCNEFFLKILAIDLAKMGPKQSRAQPKVATALSHARDVRDRLRAPLSILVALARSDDSFVPEELNAICRFVSNVDKTVHEAAHPGEADAMTELRPMIAKMRPSREALAGYMHSLEGMLVDPIMFEEFQTALNEVLWADGYVAAGEKVLLRHLGIEVA